MRRQIQALLMLSFAASAYVPPARAGGLEYAGGGTTSLGRGGASAARADSPMVLLHNPAGLAELRGSQLMLNLDTALMDACVTPIGYYGWGAYGAHATAELTDPKTGESTTIELATAGNEAAAAYFADPYDKVCLDQQLTPIPQMAFTARLTERLGIGIGLLFPAVTPQGTWGSSNGVIRGDTGELRPAATRYSLLQSSNLGIFPTVGLGYRLSDAIRVGVAFEWGMFAVNSSQASPTESGTSPAYDMIARVAAEDFFVPAMNASIHLVPFDALDIVLGARVQDDLDAEGRIEVNSGEFDPNLAKYTTRGIKTSSVTQSFPWKFWAGVRFADRLRARPTGTGQDEGNGGPGGEPVHDALGDERWDVELDLVYEMNSRVEAQDVDLLADQVIKFKRKDGTFTTPTPFPGLDTPPIYLAKKWKDQISLRAGGSYNVIPGVFAISAGAHYENRGVEPSLMRLDFWPVQRIGAHAGLRFRIAGSIDLSISYAHIFQETITVGAPPHSDDGALGVDKAAGLDPSIFEKAPPLEEQPVGAVDGIAAATQTTAKETVLKRAVIVNAGKYESSIDVISAGVQMHF